MEIKRRLIQLVLLYSLSSCLIFCGALSAQSRKAVLSARFSLQVDFQKDSFKEIPFPFGIKPHTSTAINWGIDLLIEKKASREISAYIGLGYFRNQFNFNRLYDHSLLNIGRDSFPVGTRTSNYLFHLLRLPVGATYKVLHKKNYHINLGIEGVVSFSFRQTYHGKDVFPNANHSYSRLDYYGGSIFLVSCISKQVAVNRSLEVQPYIRIWNMYRREDPFLYEPESKPHVRTFDAIGFSLKYSFNFKTGKRSRGNSLSHHLHHHFF
jgi:hypothetical protein